MIEVWQTKPLGELIDIQSGFAFKSQDYTLSGHFLIRVGNVQDGYLALDNPKYVVLDEKTSRFALREGDLLTSLTGNIGRVALVEASHLPAALNQRVARMNLKRSGILHEAYLLHFLSSSYFRQSLSSAGHGAAQQNVSPAEIGNIEVPFPSYFEQKRIVAILDEVFEEIDTAVANAEKNLASARELFDSYLNSVFTLKGDGWTEKPIALITTKIGSGATPRGGHESYKSEGTPLIRSLNVHDRRFKYDALAFLDDHQAEKLDNVIVQHGDILFNITGASVARCCQVPNEILPARVNQHVSIIRPIQSIISTRFLEYALTARPNKNGLLGVGEKGGSTRQAITKTDIQQFRLAYPSTEAQAELTSSLDALSRDTERLESIYQQKLDALTELKQSILQTAFSGRLTARSMEAVQEAAE